MGLGIAMVLATGGGVLSGAAIRDVLAQRHPGLAATEASDADDSIAFRLGDSDVVIGRMPAPIPWSDLEGPCATSILWKNAAEEVRKHEIHWIVTVNGDLPQITLSVRLTQVTAALLEASPQCLGVYWANACLLVPKPIFLAFVEKVLPLGPPLEIWVDFRIGRDGERSSAGFTTGMAALGHMEFEAKGAAEPPGELKERFASMARYVLESGPVIKDGDTIGEDADERIRVVFSDSAFGQQGKVMRLVYERPSPAKPWWKFW